MTTSDYDLLIIGGGLIGTSLACALRHTALRIGIIHPQPPCKTEPIGDSNARSIALSYGSARVFDSWGLWSVLEPFTTPIHHIHVSDRGHFGFLRLHAEDEGVPALGYVIENATLQYRLTCALSSGDWIAPAVVSHLKRVGDQWGVTVESATGSSVYTAACIIAADGSASQIRTLLSIPAQTYAYQQEALVANVSLQRAHGHTAYERLTQEGPLALLPLGAQQCALVWATASARSLQTLSEPAFLAQLQQHFGYRLGRFQAVGRREVYPLSSMHLEPHTPMSGCLLLGNAAHTLHPIAGQGFNLGIRDIEAFVRHINTYSDWATSEGISRYYAARAPDQRRLWRLTDGLVHLFSNPWLTFPRNVGLAITDTCSLLKHRLAKQGMGFSLSA